MAQNPNPSLLDPGQIIKRVFDSSEDRIRVDIESTVVAGQQEVLISQTDDSIQVYGNDGTTNRAIKTDANGELQIDVLSSALPTGAATSNNQVTSNTSLSSIDTKQSTIITGQYLRPSQFNSRIYKTAMLDRASLTTSNTLIYTVTNGKTLYVTSLVITAINSSTSNTGVVLIKDDNTTIIPFLIGTQATIVGSAPESIFFNCTFPQPISFSTAVNVTDGVGGVTASIFISGYEE